MARDLNINLMSIVTCVSEALDLVSQAVVNHHKRVANIASSIAAELDLSHEKQDALFLSAALHDAGAFSLHERLELLNFDERSPWQHSELGYRLMNTFKPFRQAAPIVRYHHVPWDEGMSAEIMERMCLKKAISSIWQTEFPFLQNAMAVGCSMSGTSSRVY
ncbi:hypothetical protein LCGC14_1860300 [marine sediment metagenome]|uniref:Uncharacterized protein n=1 Tax=marine sediment metagenome TaxID=412755 RepID=A0A0F9IM78_9ZZZZ